MTAPAQKTDSHAIVPAPVHGSNIYEITNKTTGHVVDRVAGYPAAVAAQKAQDAFVKKNGA
jgi:hypothetical protein